MWGHFLVRDDSKTLTGGLIKKNYGVRDFAEKFWGRVRDFAQKNSRGFADFSRHLTTTNLYYKNSKTVI